MSDPILEPRGKGFINVTNEMKFGGMKPVAPGVCPSCETPLGPWTPPTDAKYLQRVASFKEGYKLETMEAAHKALLDREGGIIHICVKCDTSFFIPARAVEIKS
jgi:hypothetical protein